jgi:RNA recognition motif-containing protein
VSKSSNKLQQLFLGNLNYDATLDDIRDTFMDFDISIGEVRIVKDQDTGRGKGFAFVDIDPGEPLSLAEVVSEIDGAKILGRPVRASEARPRPERGGGDRSDRHDSDPARRNDRHEKPRRPSRRRTGSSVWGEE